MDVSQDEYAAIFSIITHPPILNEIFKAVNLKWEQLTETVW